MPAISPERISDCIRLSNEIAASLLRFVSEHGAIDSALPLSCSFVNAAVDELSPNKNSVR
jgi:hypothetical protein